MVEPGELAMPAGSTGSVEAWLKVALVLERTVDKLYQPPYPEAPSRAATSVWLQPS